MSPIYATGCMSLIGLIALGCNQANDSKNADFSEKAMTLVQAFRSNQHTFEPSTSTGGNTKEFASALSSQGNFLIAVAAVEDALTTRWVVKRYQGSDFSVSETIENSLGMDGGTYAYPTAVAIAPDEQSFFVAGVAQDEQGKTHSIIKRYYGPEFKSTQWIENSLGTESGKPHFPQSMAISLDGKTLWMAADIKDPNTDSGDRHRLVVRSYSGDAFSKVKIVEKSSSGASTKSVIHGIVAGDRSTEAWAVGWIQEQDQKKAFLQRFSMDGKSVVIEKTPILPDSNDAEFSAVAQDRNDRSIWVAGSVVNDQNRRQWVVKRFENQTLKPQLISLPEVIGTPRSITVDHDGKAWVAGVAQGKSFDEWRVLSISQDSSVRVYGDGKNPFIEGARGVATSIHTTVAAGKNRAAVMIAGRAFESGDRSIGVIQKMDLDLPGKIQSAEVGFGISGGTQGLVQDLTISSDQQHLVATGTGVDSASQSWVVIHYSGEGLKTVETIENSLAIPGAQRGQANASKFLPDSKSFIVVGRVEKGDESFWLVKRYSGPGFKNIETIDQSSGPAGSRGASAQAIAVHPSGNEFLVGGWSLDSNGNKKWLIRRYSGTRYKNIETIENSYGIDEARSGTVRGIAIFARTGEWVAVGGAELSSGSQWLVKHYRNSVKDSKKTEITVIESGFAVSAGTAAIANAVRINQNTDSIVVAGQAHDANGRKKWVVKHYTGQHWDRTALVDQSFGRDGGKQAEAQALDLSEDGSVLAVVGWSADDRSTRWIMKRYTGPGYSNSSVVESSFGIDQGRQYASAQTIWSDPTGKRYWVGGHAYNPVNGSFVGIAKEVSQPLNRLMWEKKW